MQGKPLIIVGIAFLWLLIIGLGGTALIGGYDTTVSTYTLPDGEILTIESDSIMIGNFVLEEIEPANNDGITGVILLLALLPFLGFAIWYIYQTWQHDNYKRTFAQKWLDNNQELPE